MITASDFETIEGNPIAKANHYMVAVNPSTGERHINKDEVIRAYEKSFREQAKMYAGRFISSPFKLYVKAFFRTNANDLDNILKTLLDCLQDVKAISNDNLCVEIAAKKFVDKHHPRIMYAIEELHPTFW